MQNKTLNPLDLSGINPFISQTGGTADTMNSVSSGLAALSIILAAADDGGFSDHTNYGICLFADCLGAALNQQVEIELNRRKQS